MPASPLAAARACLQAYVDKDRAALLIPPLVARIHAEKKLRHKHFGSEYQAYCGRTWRLIRAY